MVSEMWDVFLILRGRQLVFKSSVQMYFTVYNDLLNNLTIVKNEIVQNN